MNLKKITSIFFVLMMAGCDFGSNQDSIDSFPNSTNSESTNLNLNETFIDDSTFLETSNIRVTLNVVYYQNESKNLYIECSFTNLGIDAVNYNIKEAYIIRESNGAKYSVYDNKTYILESEVPQTVSSYKTLPTRIDEENYVFVLIDSKNHFKFYLYNNPLNYYDVNFVYNNKTLYSKKVHRGDGIGKLYLFENPNHYEFARRWKNGNKEVDYNTVVESDLTLTPIFQNALDYLTTSSDQYSYVTGINYIFSDKICVIPSKYSNKEMCISLYAIKDIDITDLYLPRTLHKIYAGNFTNIPSLKIHYDGSENDWNTKVENNSELGKNATMIFNSRYSS